MSSVVLRAGSRPAPEWVERVYRSAPAPSAGDRGFAVPELNASALKHLRGGLYGATSGVSTSRTCEIGLSRHGGIPYRSILDLVDRAAVPRATA